MATACGRGGAAEEGPSPIQAPRVYASGQVYTVEVWGAAPSDTVVTFAVAQPRVIVLRHGPPDNTVFAEVHVPAGALVPAAAGSDSASLAVRPVPGVYGVSLESPGSLRGELRLVFKYPVHFAAPADSRATYATDVLFERALVIAKWQEGGESFQTLRSTRPASDNLEATITALGRYELIAPR